MNPRPFSALSDSAKETARDAHRYSPDYPDQDWAQFILEDWTEKLNTLGFPNAKISFSGFCSQGDGACFTADIADSKLQPPPELLAQLQAAAIPAFALGILSGDRDFSRRYDTPEHLIGDWTPYVLTAHITTSDYRYCHEMTMDIHLEVHTTRWADSEYYLPKELNDAIGDWSDTLEKDLLEEARDLARQIYKNLKEAYDAEMSDETLDDLLNDSDTLYDADGNEWADSMADEEDEEETHLLAA